MAQQDGNYPLFEDREILEILLESDLYLELPLKERHQLFKHIVKVIFHENQGTQGTC